MIEQLKGVGYEKTDGAKQEARLAPIAQNKLWRTVGLSGFTYAS